MTKGVRRNKDQAPCEPMTSVGYQIAKIPVLVVEVKISDVPYFAVLRA